MSSLLNGQLQTSAQWAALFNEADERFQLHWRGRGDMRRAA